MNISFYLQVKDNLVVKSSKKQKENQYEKISHKKTRKKGK